MTPELAAALDSVLLRMQNKQVFRQEIGRVLTLAARLSQKPVSARSAVVKAAQTHPVGPLAEPLVHAVGLVLGLWVPANEIVAFVAHDLLRVNNLPVPELDQLAAYKD